MSGSDLDRVLAAALTGLPEMTPLRLAGLLDGYTPGDAWDAVRDGSHPGDPRHRFTASARATDVEEVREQYARTGVEILLPDRPGYPSALVGDPGAPAVLFALGDPSVIEERPRVAIVGTRSPTPYGLNVASDIAADLADAGVVVVSGLALGIDGAAHAGVVRSGGATAAPPAAVVGTGLDTPYPHQNRGLWAEVVSTGVVFSEAALGTPPIPRVFPARNRIIAALSDVVVVVESHYKGGSTYTVEAAARRSIPVCAVPGSVRSRPSDGTNQLLVDGCAPVRDATDVLVAVYLAREAKGKPLGLPLVDDSDAGRSDLPNEATLRSSARQGPVGAAKAGRGTARKAVSAAATREAHAGGARRVGTLSPVQSAVLAAIDDTPTPLETVLIRTNLSVASAALACSQLTEQGRLQAGAGWWSRT